MPVESTHEEMTVLADLRDHPNEPRYAYHLIGHLQGIQSWAELDDIYRRLEEQQLIEAWGENCASYKDKNTGEVIYRTRFRYRPRE